MRTVSFSEVQYQAQNAVERGFDKVYGMLHGILGLLDEQYIDLSTQIHSELDIMVFLLYSG